MAKFLGSGMFAGWSWFIRIRPFVVSVFVLGSIHLASQFLVAADDVPGLALFESKVRPVLVERCYSCHSAKAEKLKGGLRLDSREGIRHGGDSGPAVVPGKPRESTLIQAIAYTNEFAKMPPKGKLPDSVIADIRRWVEVGAPDPRERTRDRSPSKEPKTDHTDWWSLKPIARTRVPELSDSDREYARNPIDAFILSQLGKKGLRPSAEADRQSLIRRLSFDLLGLPPTPEEISAFGSDAAPDAYERLVNRLLASPHHGERWARHWMDLVHFAETHGHDQDRIRPNAWPYRDYLISSFNLDKPYARFIQEQVAADAIFPDEPALVVALGMIAAGPWDESSLRDIRDDSIDRQIGHYIDRDDMVSTVMSTFVSMTVHCARCHDHKFDPISQEDYYGLQAVFAGVDRAERAYDADAGVAQRRQELVSLQVALRRKDPVVLARMLDPAVQSTVSEWETQNASAGPAWRSVRPDLAEATGGVTLAIQPDLSILASGARPAESVYILSFRLTPGRITGLRLEVIPDDRLPSRGPGRNENGNLHLTEIEILAGLENSPGSMHPVRINRAVADFDQVGWAISGAIDRNPQTAWGIFPHVGKPHEAVFEFAEGLEISKDSKLVVRLKQSFPANHLIGRLRLSLTSDSVPFRVVPLPEGIVSIRAIAPSKRTPVQRQELAAYLEGQRIERELAALPPQRFVFAAASDFAPDAGHKPPPGPRPVYVLKRGDINHPGKAALPGALSCMSGLPGQFSLAAPGRESDRRMALARWLSDPRNPLTHRSIVNRVWQHHFGKGLVDTPNDFGRMGSTPTHPELLDWLAGWLLDHGGSLKDLHRLIVTSAAYRQNTVQNERFAAIDADNRLLWRMNQTRLDAESVHDAILLASGELDRMMGGPSVRQFTLGAGVHVTPVVDYTKFDWSGPDARRRSVYRFLFRTLPDPFMDALDEADASQLTAARNESITPLQAMALLNNPFVLGQSEHLARRLERLGKRLDDQVAMAYLYTLGRPPSREERAEAVDHARVHGLANLCRLLFNSNEFLFTN